MKLKILCAFWAISAFFCIPAQAQEETRHEVSISYGTIPNSIWFDIFDEAISDIAGMKFENDSRFGPIGLEYFYHTSPLVGVGAVATLAKNEEDGIHNNQAISKLKHAYYTLMPAVKLNWLRRTHWGMYSKLALGATYIHRSEDMNNKTLTDNCVLFNFQASALGIEAGSQHVFGFAELGIGEQGIMLGGVRFKF